MSYFLDRLISVTIVSGVSFFVASDLFFSQLGNDFGMAENLRDNSLNPSQRILISQNVTSVSQLSDVKKSDSAFTALQSLVERYGCVAGYPDRTFRGIESLTRYDFAIYLNACLDKLNEIISAGLADKTTKEDLIALQKLQEDFAAELATVRGRLDVINARLTKLENQKQSPTVESKSSQNETDYTIVILAAIFGVVTLIIVFRVTSR
jgi:hypothetical protein